MQVRNASRASASSQHKLTNSMIKRIATKSEQLIQQSNFHQLRQIRLEQEKVRALEEAKKRKAINRLVSDIEGGIEEAAGKQEDDDDGVEPSSPARNLQQIEEDCDEELQESPEDAQKFIRVSKNDKNVIELTSPNTNSVVKIRNPKIPIASDYLRFQELMHIENAIIGMTTMPDFGYDGDNFVIERSQDAPRNWKLLTDFVYNKDKYEWLQNHLTLRKIRI